MKVAKENKSMDGLVELNKAIKAYIKNMEKSEHLNIQSKDVTYSNFFENKMLIIHSIRKGFSYKMFNHIQEITPFTESDWAEYLNVSVKTLQRHRTDDNYFFKPIHTEKIIELAEVTNFGQEVFDSLDQFYIWLNTPSYALGNLTPHELLKDSYGKELVMSELNRIDQGIFV